MKKDVNEFTELISITYFYSLSHVYNNTVESLSSHFFYISFLLPAFSLSLAFFIHKFKKKRIPAGWIEEKKCFYCHRMENIFIFVASSIFLISFTPSFNAIIFLIFFTDEYCWLNVYCCVLPLPFRHLFFIFYQEDESTSEFKFSKRNHP